MALRCNLAAARRQRMKVLILGANGYLGPHVVKALEAHYELRLTDIKPIETDHESIRVECRLLG